MGVGRLIDKLFGGGKRSATLRAYGKLPMYAEYRRLEVAPGAPTAFTQWMDEGRLAWVRSPAKSTTGVTRASRLLIGLPGTKEAVVASVWESRDSLGRTFPFAFFIVCPREVLGRDAIEHWAAAIDVYHAFDHLYAQLHALGSGGDFYRFYQGHTIALRPEDLAERTRALRDQAAQIAAERWLKALTLDGDVTPAMWSAGVLQRARRWRAQPASLADAAVSCPLARGFPYDHQIVVWLEWFSGLCEKTGKTPWLIAPTGTERSAPSLSLVMRDLLPDDYQLLTSDDRSYSFVEHLSALPADTDVTVESIVVPPAGALLAWLRQHTE